MADMGGFDLSMMPQDYSYVQPGGAGQSFDWSQPSFASMPDMGGWQPQMNMSQFGGGAGNFAPGYAGPTAPQSPYMSDVLSSRTMYPNQQGDQTGNIADPFAPKGPTQQTFGPSLGQPTGSAGSTGKTEDKDSWMKMLAKLGVQGAAGLGVGAIGSMMQPGAPKQQQPQATPQMAAPSPLPTPPSPVATPTAAPLQELPGTNASPLISGMPTQVQQSKGLNVQDRMRRGGSTGGLQLY